MKTIEKKILSSHYSSAFQEDGVHVCVGMYRSYIHCIYAASIYIQYIQLNKVKFCMLLIQYLIEVLGRKVGQKHKYQEVDVFVLILKKICALTLEAVNIS